MSPHRLQLFQTESTFKLMKITISTVKYKSGYVLKNNKNPTTTHERELHSGPMSMEKIDEFYGYFNLAVKIFSRRPFYSNYKMLPVFLRTKRR